MKKLSNKILIITLLLLAAVFVLSRLFLAPGRGSNLRKDLVKLDTAGITDVRIRPSSHPEAEVILHREGRQWSVSKEKQQSETDEGLVKSMLGMLLHVEAQRMVSHKKEKWEDFKPEGQATKEEQ